MKPSNPGNFLDQTREPGTPELLRTGTGAARAALVPGVRDHTQLDVWKLSDALRNEVYRLTIGRAL